MATTKRVTVTLPVELVESIDRHERNRSRFIAEAVEHELGRRRRDGLLRSLKSPHPEAAELAETGLADWGASGELYRSQRRRERDHPALRPTRGTCGRRPRPPACRSTELRPRVAPSARVW